MTTRERLHKLVDELDEAEAESALRHIALRHESPLVRWLDAMPPEDEEISAEEEAAAAAGRADIAAGRTFSLEEVKGEFGLP